MSPMPWLRLYTDIVDDEKLRLLAFEDRWHFVALMALKGDGLLDDECETPLLRRKVAVKLGLQVRELEEVERRLAEVGLVTLDEGRIDIPGWEKRQFLSDSSTDRVRKHREKAKKNKALQAETPDVTEGNVTATLHETFHETDPAVSVTPPDTESDTDTEAEGMSSPSASLQEKTSRRSPAPVDAIVQLFSKILPELPQPVRLDDGRRKAIAARHHDTFQHREGWQAYFEAVREQPFLMGRNDRNWSADIDWLMKPANINKVVERKYANAA